MKFKINPQNSFITMRKDQHCQDSVGCMWGNLDCWIYTICKFVILVFFSDTVNAVIQAYNVGGRSVNNWIIFFSFFDFSERLLLIQLTFLPQSLVYHSAGTYATTMQALIRYVEKNTRKGKMESRSWWGQKY